MYLLHETSSGYALFEKLAMEEIGQELDVIQQALGDSSKFKKMVALKGFSPFKSASHALENIMDVSEGKLFLSSFLVVSSSPSNLVFESTVHGNLSS